MLNQVPDAQWSQLSEFVAATMGLHFPRERRADLQRGLAGAAREFGFDDAAACADWLMSAPPTKAQIEVLASHLTVGETYFFREKKTFDVLANSILPELVRSRRGREQRLRFWSAACCTGEEPFSLAMLVHQSIPDLANWHVTILATDINARFLHKAAAGSYGEWSFRDTPASLKERYFNRTADGRYSIIPEIKKLVNFAHLNLADDVYPSLTTDTNAMDVIFCRNVLMYFAPPQLSRVIGKLHHALVEGGWLVVSPSEASQALFPQFVTVNLSGAIFYQKSDAKLRTQQPPMPTPLSETTAFVAPAIETPAPWAPPMPADLAAQLLPALSPEEPAPDEFSPVPYAVAESLYQQGRYTEAADTLLGSFAENSRVEPALFSLLARALANQGKLADALTWCDRWIAADKLDSTGHYLRAVVLLERGDLDHARASLQRAIYLHPELVLAHFALGNLARGRGKNVEADKHFANALRLLRGRQLDDLLPESDGLTAGRLIEIITAMTAIENAP
jgi:chemotaxis protein methyltransferase CheR